MIEKFAAILVFSLIIHEISSVCPKNVSFQPCNCKKGRPFVGGSDGPVIECRGKENIDLVKLFENLSKNLTKNEKHFTQFSLSNSALTQLKDNTFKDITFESIIVYDANKLTRIHKNAFNGTNGITKYIKFLLNPSIKAQDLYDALSQFTVPKVIDLIDNNITDIPSNAFNPPTGHQDSLEQLDIEGETLKTLGNNAFSKFSNLSHLTIFGTNIDYIPENAFAFEKSSDKLLRIDLYSNSRLNASSFAINSFANIRRPTHLAIRNVIAPKIVLNEQVFKPFLLDNKKNVLDLNAIFEGKLDCQDCHNYWLKKNPDLLKRVINFKCESWKNFDDPTNFKNC